MLAAALAFAWPKVRQRVVRRGLCAGGLRTVVALQTLRSAPENHRAPASSDTPLTAAVLVLWWLYPTLAVLGIQIFQCSSNGGVDFLRADTSLQCAGTEYVFAALIAGLVVLPVVLLAPTLLIAMAVAARLSSWALLEPDGDALQRIVGGDNCWRHRANRLARRCLRWLHRLHPLLADHPAAEWSAQSLVSLACILGRRLALAAAVALPHSVPTKLLLAMLVLAAAVILHIGASSALADHRSRLVLLALGSSLVCCIFLTLASVPPDVQLGALVAVAATSVGSEASGNSPDATTAGTANIQTQQQAIRGALGAAFVLTVLPLTYFVGLLALAWWRGARKGADAPRPHSV
jgi:hypothetical protein